MRWPAAFVLFLALFAQVPACKHRDRQENATAEGMLTETPSKKIRIYALHSGLFRVWVSDKSGGGPSTDGIKVRLKLDTAGYPEVVMEPRTDHFQGKGPQVPSEHADAVITIEIGGESSATTETTRIRLHM